MMGLSSWWYWILLGLISLFPWEGGCHIDCFKCVSLNGDNPSCEDPFSHNFSSSFLQAPCMGGRKGRDGLYPATACIKITGRFTETGRTITVRDCALDSGSDTADTELIRMSHCGSFYFDDKYVKGCVQSCDDSDGCNSAPLTLSKFTPYVLQLLLRILLFAL